MENDCHYVFTIFGATGDLTKRKLLPALYFLEAEGHILDNFSILCVARKKISDADYRTQAAVAIQDHSRIKVEDDLLDKLVKRIHYHHLDFADPGNRYEDLKKCIEKLSGRKAEACERIYYLAVSPDFFKDIVLNLKETGLARSEGKHPHDKVVFEKPFGRDLESAKHLNKKITQVFKEKQIYRIDHYLGKELVQNLIVMRFGNAIFEPLWNTEYIDHVQITVAETLGVGSRGKYYDRAGSLRDVVQNHILQLLCLTAMDSPKSLDADHIRDQKVKVLKSIHVRKNIKKSSIKAQYRRTELDGRELPGYREEVDVDHESTTSSFFAIKFAISNSTWRNVPFYVRTGKRLKERATEIVIIYKDPKEDLFKRDGHHIKQNKLIIRVQPDEGISFEFNAKVPGSKIEIENVNMDFCHECKFGPDTAEAYERLLHDVMKGDQTLFTRWDEVEQAWKIIDVIRDVWHKEDPEYYKAGTWGPEEADKLIQKDDREWAVPKKPYYAGLLEKNKDPD